MRFERRLSAMATVALAGLGACSGSTQPPQATVTLTSVATTTITQPPQTTSETQSSTSMSTTSNLSTTATESNGPGATSASSTGPVIIREPTGTEKVLTLADAFAAENWTEELRQPAGKAAQQQAIATRVYCGQESSPLEFRFAEQPGTLRLTVAQDMASASSDAKVEFALIVDGRRLESKAITFKETTELSASLSGASVVNVIASTKESCSRNTVIALITKAVITK